MAMGLEGGDKSPDSPCVLPLSPSKQALSPGDKLSRNQIPLDRYFQEFPQSLSAREQATWSQTAPLNPAETSRPSSFGVDATERLSSSRIQEASASPTLNLTGHMSDKLGHSSLISVHVDYTGPKGQKKYHFGERFCSSISGRFLLK